MKLNNGFGNKGKKISITRNQVVSVKGKGVRIECLSGEVWVTWPNGLEESLSRGGTALIDTKGKICIQAFSDALVEVHKNGFQPFGFMPPVPERMKWIPLRDAC